MTFNCHFWNKYPNNNKISMNSQKSLKIRPNMTRIYQKPSKSCSFVRNSLDMAIFSLKTPKMIKTMLENNFFREKIWLGGIPWGTTYGVPPPPCCRTLRVIKSYPEPQFQLKTGNFWFFGFPELATMCKIDSKSFQIHLDPPVEGVRMANIEVEVASTRCMPPAVPKLFNWPCESGKEFQICFSTNS